jgi:phosphoglycolate phosphatase
MNRALELRGFPKLPAEEYKKRVGWGLKRLAYLSLPEDARTEEAVEVLASDALRHYAENPFVYSRPYPGVLDLLGILKKNNVKTIVLTNKPDLIAQKVCTGLFPTGSFDYVQGELQGKPRKPDPACVWEILVSLDLIPANTIFVGDSEIDMQTAVSAGCFPMGVSWGYRSREIIQEAGARRIIDTACELLELFTL